jgi:hypothetical protein
MGQKTVRRFGPAEALKRCGQRFSYSPSSDEKARRQRPPKDTRNPCHRPEELLVKGKLSLNLSLRHGGDQYSVREGLCRQVNRPEGLFEGKEDTVSWLSPWRLKPKANASETVIFRYGEGDKEDSLGGRHHIHKGESRHFYLRK